MTGPLLEGDAYCFACVDMSVGLLYFVMPSFKKAGNIDVWLSGLVYCKRGYFCWGKFSRKCWQDLLGGSYFHDCAPISSIKPYGFYFSCADIFAMKSASQKTQKLPPLDNFHVHSMYIGFPQLVQSKNTVNCDTKQSISKLIDATVTETKMQCGGHSLNP